MCLIYTFQRRIKIFYQRNNFNEMNHISTERKLITVFYYQNQKNWKKVSKTKTHFKLNKQMLKSKIKMTAIKLRTSLRSAFDAATRTANFAWVQTMQSPSPPMGPRKSTRKEAAQERPWEGKKRCGLCLRKNKERKNKERKKKNPKIIGTKLI
jgi:hypothetical protein